MHRSASVLFNGAEILLIYISGLPEAQFYCTPARSALTTAMYHRPFTLRSMPRIKSTVPHAFDRINEHVEYLPDTSHVVWLRGSTSA